MPLLTERMPDAEWLPLAGPLGTTRLEVVVLLDGRPTLAVLDTGAATSAVSVELASRLGLRALLDDRGRRLLVSDSHGAVGDAWQTKIDTIAIGRVWIDDVTMTVMPMGREVVLIGYDVLRHHDLVMLADLGVVGLLPAGTAPREGRAVAVRLDEHDRALLIDVSAPGRSDVARTTLIVDTGADITSFPSTAAMLAGVPVDLRLRSTSIGVHTTKQQPGLYALSPLRLGAGGTFHVGNVHAWENLGDDGTLGLLGNDVLGRSRTTLVSADADGGPRLYFADVPQAPVPTTCRASTAAAPVKKKPSTRRLDADEADILPKASTSTSSRSSSSSSGIEDPCLHVRLKAVGRSERAAFVADNEAVVVRLEGDSGDSVLEDGSRAKRDDVCLEVELRQRVANERVAFVVVDAADTLYGGGISVIANVDHALPDDAICLPLSERTRQLGLKAGDPLTLRAVRIDHPADAALCPVGTCFWHLGI